MHLVEIRRVEFIQLLDPLMQQPIIKYLLRGLSTYERVFSVSAMGLDEAAGVYQRPGTN